MADGLFEFSALSGTFLPKGTFANTSGALSRFGALPSFLAPPGHYDHVTAGDLAVVTKCEAELLADRDRLQILLDKREEALRSKDQQLEDRRLAASSLLEKVEQEKDTHIAALEQRVHQLEPIEKTYYKLKAMIGLFDKYGLTILDERGQQWEDYLGNGPGESGLHNN